jgi:hypothetical protein
MPYFMLGTLFCVIVPNSTPKIYHKISQKVVQRDVNLKISSNIGRHLFSSTVNNQKLKGLLSLSQDAWKEKDNPNMFFTTYEQMSKDLRSVALKLIQFLGQGKTLFFLNTPIYGFLSVNILQCLNKIKMIIYINL